MLLWLWESFCVFVSQGQPWPTSLTHPAAGVVYLGQVRKCLGKSQRNVWMGVFTVPCMWGGVVVGIHGYGHPGMWHSMSVCLCVSVWKFWWGSRCVFMCVWWCGGMFCVLKCESKWACMHHLLHEPMSRWVCECFIFFPIEILHWALV